MALPSILGADGQPTAASTFLVVHEALRRDLARFTAAVGRLDDEGAGGGPTALAAFRSHWQSYRGILDSHHRQEDEQLFPTLLAAAPGLGDLLGVLEEKHRTLDTELDRVAGWIDRLPDPDAVQGAVAAFGELADFLVFHLDTEEAHLVPVMLSEAFTEVEVEVEVDFEADVDGADDMPPAVDFGEVAPAFALPWCADGLDEQVVQVLLAGLPEPLQAAFPEWQQAYREELSLWL